MSDFKRDIQHEINKRLDALEDNIGSRKFKDKQEFIKGAFFELQDLKEWIQDKVVETNREKADLLADVGKCDHPSEYVITFYNGDSICKKCEQYI